MRTLAIWTVLAAAGWAQDGGYDPYDKPKQPPFQLHDHVKIVVSERARALSSTDLRTDRRARVEVSLDEWIQFESRTAGLPKLTGSGLTGNPGIDLDGRFRQDNLGRTSRQFDLTFTIMAEVMDIKPNGVLVLEARKRRQVNGETETIRLTGMVSPRFVDASRTTTSSEVLNLDIEYDGEGTTGDGAKLGLLGWLLSKLWPF
ncbi:MAG: flagellar basal body L-ring protein FlgH [Planctomycetota bacterium]|jgi:flagellar L-ring protein precursor FlgH